MTKPSDHVVIVSMVCLVTVTIASFVLIGFWGLFIAAGCYEAGQKMLELKYGKQA